METFLEITKTDSRRIRKSKQIYNKKRDQISNQTPHRKVQECVDSVITSTKHLKKKYH